MAERAVPLFSFPDHNVDFTKFIKAPTYKVNKQEMYYEWTDGAQVNHRSLVRNKLAGSFTMFFSDANEYSRFLTCMEKYKGQNTKDPLAYKCQFYDNKTELVVESEFFIDFELTLTVPFFGVKEYDGFTVTIEER